MAKKQAGAFRRAWRQSGLRGTKVFATALAAIAMALIAPRIAGLTSSLIAVGLVSVVSALVNAFISSAAEATAESAKKLTAVGAPSRDADAGGLEAAADGPTGPEGTSGLAAAATQVLPPASADSAPGAGDEPAGPGSSSSSEASGGSPTRLKRIFRSNYIYLVLFAVIAVVTIYVTYVVSHATGNTTLIRPTVTHELSEEERQALIDEAVSVTLATLGATEVPTDPVPGETPTPLTLDGLAAVQEAIDLRLTTLEGQEVTDNADVIAELERLQERLAELERQLEEAGVVTPSPLVPSPSPSPSPEQTPGPEVTG